MQLLLTIELGNDAMESGEDVAGALASVAARLNRISGALGDGDEGAIMDENGNTCGNWRVVSMCPDCGTPGTWCCEHSQMECSNGNCDHVGAI